MAWLRIDDGFTKHPKFEGWSIADRWAWLEVMEYCARYETDGRIPTDFTLLPRTCTTKLLDKATAARWCHRGSDGALWINDWEVYNPPRRESEEALDEAVANVLRDQPEASANQVVRIVGGNRKAVLDSIRRFRRGSQTGSEVVPAGGSGTGSRAGARARPRPVPETLSEGDGRDPDTQTAATQDAPPPDDAQHRRWNGRAITETGAQPDRAGVIGPGLRQRYTPEHGDTYVRNALVHIPEAHREDDLHERFPDIPDDEVHRLLDLAADLESEKEPHS